MGRNAAFKSRNEVMDAEEGSGEGRGHKKKLIEWLMYIFHL